MGGAKKGAGPRLSRGRSRSLSWPPSFAELPPRRHGPVPGPPTGRWALLGPQLRKFPKVHPRRSRAVRARGQQRQGRAAGWRRRGASGGEFPRKAELIPSFMCISLHPASRWRTLSVRVVFGRGRDEAVIGLIRVGAARTGFCPGSCPGSCSVERAVLP